MTHWITTSIIDMSCSFDRYGDWSIWLPGLLCTEYIIDCIVLSASSIHDGMSLCCLKDPSLMPVLLPDVIIFSTVVPWSMDHILLISQWSSISNYVVASCKLLINTFVLSGIEGMIHEYNSIVCKTSYNTHLLHWCFQEEYNKVMGLQQSFLHYVLNPCWILHNLYTLDRVAYITDFLLLSKTISSELRNLYATFLEDILTFYSIWYLSSVLIFVATIPNFLAVCWCNVG